MDQHGMSRPDRQYLIGVDGGGTSCRIALLRDGQRFEVALERANVASDRDGAIATIRQGLDSVLAKAGLTPGDLAHCKVYMGLAGILSTADSADVARAFQANHIAVFDDRELALRHALGDTDGAIASIGTGSFIGRRSKTSVRYIGGWGLVLDDAASGAWLGRAAFRDTVRAVDGFHPETPLTAEILADFDNSAADLVGFSLSASPADFASYAPLVVAKAAKQDAVAIRLMHLGADYICRSLAVLGWQTGETLCLIGGLGPHYTLHLPDAIAASVVAPKGSALDVALTLAAGLGREGTP
ncbi:MAG: glucosamine kinase [Paracoccaceae bacterium]|jgi:glucosamine kinase